MSALHFSLPVTLEDLRAASEHVERTLVHLAELGKILDRIHQRLEVLATWMSDTDRVPDPVALLLLEQPEFGRAMRHMREALGLTREHLAHLSGLATSTLRNLEARSNLFLSDRVRHRIVIALAGQSRIRPRRNKPRA